MAWCLWQSTKRDPRHATDLWDIKKAEDGSSIPCEITSNQRRVSRSIKGNFARDTLRRQVIKEQMFRAIFRSTEPMKSKTSAGKSEQRNSSSEREEEVDEMSVIRRDPASVCPDVPTQQHDKSPHKNTASQSATNASLTRRRSWRLGLPFPRWAQFFRGRYSILRAILLWQRPSFICSGICSLFDFCSFSRP